MILMVFMVIVIVLVAYYADFSGDDIARRQNEGAVVAEQLQYYHAAATRACDGVCAAGPIAGIQAQLSSPRRNKGAYADGTLLSVSQGEYVVSWYRDPLQDSNAVQAREVYSQVVPSLVDDRNTSMWAGAYNAATGKVVTTVPAQWRNLETGVLQPVTRFETVTVVVPAIPDQAPVIVTRK